MTIDSMTSFLHLKLNESLLKALNDVGYETPSPIQAKTIPYLLEGRDVLGQAQTGTGKTAAFALPILSNLDLKAKDVQVLVLAPTRELAIQVAEAFQTYAKYLNDFHVLPVYGGQNFSHQIQTLRRGVHVVVGTPGRVMDHMRRGTLKLDRIKTLVLDEADEMLRMGFIDDVEWILSQTPQNRQIALFSATMPEAIRRIANQYLNNPASVTIKVKTTTAETIHQRYWVVSGVHKLDALTRILEAENYDGVIVFVKTKLTTIELAEKLSARGFITAALNGDIPQNQRETTIEKLKQGKLDVLVATDVAARGLDVERISHVINYDIPYDTEAYVHRIGRTGRAGRVGDAILFVAPRERRLLHAIEKATNQKIEAMDLPTAEVINEKRVASFYQRLSDVLANDDLSIFQKLIEDYQKTHNASFQDIACALAKLYQGEKPLLMEKEEPRKTTFKDKEDKKITAKKEKTSFKKERQKHEEGMERYRIEVGHIHNVMPKHIVGAIANEVGIESQYIGEIRIFDDYSLVDLPEGMPKSIFKHLHSVRVMGQMLKINKAEDLQHQHKSAKKNKGKVLNKPVKGRRFAKHPKGEK